jgi:hypothetical protein
MFESSRDIRTHRRPWPSRLDDTVRDEPQAIGPGAGADVIDARRSRAAHAVDDGEEAKGNLTKLAPLRFMRLM